MRHGASRANAIGALLALILAGCGGGGAASTGLEVAGLVTSSGGSPRAFVPVVINGTRLVVSGHDGRFTVSGVSVPYTAAVIDPVRPQATVYVGLTRPDPTLTLWWEESTNRGTMYTQVSGGVGYPLPANHNTYAHLVGNNNLDIHPGVHSATGYTSTGSGAAWAGASTTQALLLVLQYSQDAAGNVINYTGFKAVTGLMKEGEDVPFPLVALDPVGTMELQGTIALPPGFNFTELATHAVLSSALRAHIHTEYADPGGTFAVRAPTIAGVGFSLTLSATDGAGRILFTRVAAPAFPSDVVLDSPPPHDLLAPLDGTAGIDYDTVFSCTPSTLGAYVFTVWGAGPSRYAVITADPEAKIPDLSAFGLDLGAAQSYSWSAVAIGPFASVDEVAEAPGMNPAGPRAYWHYPPAWSLTTAP